MPEYHGRTSALQNAPAKRDRDWIKKKKNVKLFSHGAHGKRYDIIAAGKKHAHFMILMRNFCPGYTLRVNQETLYRWN